MTQAPNLHRRRLAAVAALGASAALIPYAQARRTHSVVRPRRINPPALKRGDLVALFNPSGHADDTLIQRSTLNLEKLGFRVHHAAHLRAARGNAAGTIGQRLTDIHSLFNHREVRALWAARGGSAAAQLLPYIDYSLVARNPKIVIGYSDITALHLALYAKAGLVSFHGPVASSSFTPFTVAQLEAVLMEPRSTHVMRTADEHVQRALTERHFAQRVIRSGRAEGVLVGGNLSVFASMIGTPFLPHEKDTLLFLEEISEAPYRVDRMLTQLEQSDNLRNVRGAMLGVFVKCEPTGNEESLVLSQALDDHFSARPIPSAYGLSFGHIASQWILPVGVRARFDADARSLTLLEAATT